MIRIWATLFGLAVAICAGLYVSAIFAQAANNLSGNAARTNPSDLKSFHDAFVTETGEQDHD
jgi:hypothetical protein